MQHWEFLQSRTRHNQSSVCALAVQIPPLWDKTQSVGVHLGSEASAQWLLFQNWVKLWDCKCARVCALLGTLCKPNNGWICTSFKAFASMCHSCASLAKADVRFFEQYHSYLNLAISTTSLQFPDTLNEIRQWRVYLLRYARWWLWCATPCNISLPSLQFQHFICDSFHLWMRVDMLIYGIC